MDARKSLARFHGEWDDCQQCLLGEQRSAFGKDVIHGSGEARRIMIVLRSPSWKHEEGQFTEGEVVLREMIRMADAVDDVYVTYATSCRGCTPVMDVDTGLPKMRNVRGKMLPQYRDTPPTNDQVKACLARLHEEVYLVDPVIVLACGESAIHALMGRVVSANSLYGTPTHFQVKGAGVRPRLTEKKKAWGRKVNGVMHFPVDPFMVNYLMIPTHDLEFVLRNISDTRRSSPAVEFQQHLRDAVRIYQQSLTGGFSDGIAEEVPPEPVEEEDVEG